MTKSIFRNQANERLDFLVKELEQGDFMLDVDISIMKDECIHCIKREYDLLDNYEAFVECLRTDVYAALYRRVEGFYGFIEPITRRR